MTNTTKDDHIINVRPDLFIDGAVRVECTGCENYDDAQLTMFFGPHAHQRASLYAHFLNMLRTDKRTALKELVYGLTQ